MIVENLHQHLCNFLIIILFILTSDQIFFRFQPVDQLYLVFIQIPKNWDELEIFKKKIYYVLIKEEWEYLLYVFF